MVVWGSRFLQVWAVFLVGTAVLVVAQENHPPGNTDAVVPVKNGVLPQHGKRYGGLGRNDVTVRRYGNGHNHNNNHQNNHHNGLTTTTTNNNNNNNNNHNMHDGHRMITRALWRIFDALMQKKDHSQLYGRVGFVEEALKKMISVDSQLEGEIDKLKEDMQVCKSQLSSVMEELGRLKTMNTRLLLLEHSQPNDMREQGDGVWGASAAFSTCPPPFSRVGGECFYLSRDEMLGWEDARRECGRLGGDLASPTNLSMLRDHLTDVEDPPEYLWVGGSKQDDGSWVWSSGSQAGVPIDMSKSTWNEEVPSGAGKCMGLFGQSSYRAYNYDCKERDYFVCQYMF